MPRDVHYKYMCVLNKLQRHPSVKVCLKIIYKCVYYRVYYVLHKMEFEVSASPKNKFYSVFRKRYLYTYNRKVAYVFGHKLVSKFRRLFLHVP